jgi:enoyl-CoA hydratase
VNVSETDASSAEVLIQRDGEVLVVMINRPQVRNAMNQSTAQAIAAAMDDLDADPILRIGVLTGAGGTFCSGMDLKAFLRGERPEIDGRGFGGITERPPVKPLIAAVEGYALAGGCELVLACDLVVASDSASFGLPEVTRGLVAGSGGAIRLPQRIPHQVAMEYLLTGAHLPAIEAHRWGLVNRLTKPGEALDGALELARQISANGPLGVAMTKRIVTQSMTWPPNEVWDRQHDLVESVLASDDAKEGAAAFAEKRPPVWKGR